MGNFHSIPSRAERRRTNRLSKPLTDNSCLSPINAKTPASNSHASSPVSPCSPTWRDPWSGSSIPVSPRVFDCNGFLPQPTLQSEAPRRPGAWNARSDSIAEEGQDERLYDLFSPTSDTTASMTRRPSLQPIRRDSLKPDTLRSYSQSPFNPKQPRRSHSLQSHPQKPKTTIYENTLEEATSSNTYFMVDSQRFSISRRRSLLTRPGVATRKSTREPVRRPSAVGHESEYLSKGSDERSKSLQLPSPEREEAVANPCYSSTFARPDTPSDFGYTHLGALKLGSLRVVNRSTSPCPSNRTRLNVSCSSPPDDVPESMGRNRVQHPNGCPRIQTEEVLPGHEPIPEEMPNMASRKLSTSMLQLPPLSDVKGQEDVPGSPFSFDKSPTTTFPNPASPFARDEEISSSNEESTLDCLGYTPVEGGPGRKSSRPLAKADSGYSSATSVCSQQDKYNGESTGSQLSNQRSWESGNVEDGFESRKVHGVQRSGSNKTFPIQRHLSLREYPTAFDSSTIRHGTQQIKSNGHTRGDLRRAVSYSRRYVPPNSLESPAFDTETRFSPQTQRVEGTRDRLSYSYTDGYASKPSGSRISHHKSISAPSPGGRSVRGTTGRYNVQNHCQFDINAPSYNNVAYSQLQTRGSATKNRPPRHFTTDMANEQYLRSPRPSTEFYLPRSPFVFGQMETVEEKDPAVTLPGRPSEKTRSQNIENQQSKFVGPRRRKSIYMATAPFIFH